VRGSSFVLGFLGRGGFCLGIMALLEIFEFDKKRFGFFLKKIFLFRVFEKPSWIMTSHSHSGAPQTRSHQPWLRHKRLEKEKPDERLCNHQHFP